MKKIGLSVVGSGVIAKKVLKEIFGLCNVVSVFSRNAASAQLLAEKYGAKPCTVFEDVLTDETVDCVYVATPHTTHCHYASLALKAGKHVICEKPAAMNQLQLRQMLSFAEANHVYFSEIMHFRYSPVFRELKGILDAGAYGKLKRIYADIGFDAYSLPKRKRLLNKDAGGGALLDIGIYIAALAEFVFGDVAPGRCTLHVEKNEDGVDVEDKLCGEINGVPCEFLCSLRRVLPSAAVLEFEYGKVEIPVFFKPNKFILKSEQGTQIVEKGKFSFQAQFQKAFEDMKNGCNESEPFDHVASGRTAGLLDRIRKQGEIAYAPELEGIDVLE